MIQDKNIRAAWESGAHQAAAVAADYNSSTTHPYRLEDCILGKLNIRKAAPRRNLQAVTCHEHSWLQGLANGLVSMNEDLLGGSNSKAVIRACHAAGATLDDFRRAKVLPSLIKALKKAGVK